MSKELDISWFDLNNYEGLNELDLIGWHRQIQIRSLLLNFGFDGLKFWIDHIKTNPIIKPYIPNDGDEGTYQVVQKGISTVNSTTALLYWQVSSDSRFSHIWDVCMLDDACDITEEQLKLIETPMSELYASIGVCTEDSEEVTIDLSASDEQITKDFCLWLSEYRKISSYKFTKNNFTHKDFKGWIQWRLLPYVDLVIISKFEAIEIKQTKIAQLIFSDDSSDVDIVDKTRRTTKPKAKS